MKKIYSVLFVLIMICASNITKAQIYYVSTYGGTSAGNPTDDVIASVKFRSPERLTYDNDSNMIVVDRGNHVIRKITPAGLVTTIAGSGTAGYKDDNGTSAQFSNPWGAVVDATGNIYVADRDNFRIRKIAPNGDVTTLAGSAAVTGVDNDNPLLASFKQPLDVIFDNNGNLLVADGVGHKIRKIATDGKVTTLAGTGVTGFKDDSNPLLAQFASPSGLGIDKDGNILVADRINNRIRKINSTNNVSTIVGSGTKGTVDNNSPLLAQLSEPYYVDVDADGNMYVVELAHTIRKIASDGKVSVIAGIGGTLGFLDGKGSDAKFYNPAGLCIAKDGTIYVADVSNNKIRKLSTINPLPVKLVSFQGKLDKANGITLSWSTASEQNNAYFELQKSNDGINWSLLQTITGKGNSDQLLIYSYADVSPFNGNNYYLLKQVDFNGKSSLTAPINVNFNLSQVNKLSAYYNNGALAITAQGFTNGNGQIVVRNLNGQVITSQDVNLVNGVNEFAVPVNLQSGLYVLSLLSTSGNQSLKFVAKN
ncbi:hypothetical protein [Pedobacter arcticus]|uniref:hypothetical protein n=1 Tax=Pedobacter arcticus TaxID=752140 RepID=UPI000364FEA2|nr:hypothetical protein [Pedobacter arcticus]